MRFLLKSHIFLLFFLILPPLTSMWEKKSLYCVNSKRNNTKANSPIFTLVAITDNTGSRVKSIKLNQVNQADSQQQNKKTKKENYLIWFMIIYTYYELCDNHTIITNRVKCKTLAPSAFHMNLMYYDVFYNTLMCILISFWWQNSNSAQIS